MKRKELTKKCIYVFFYFFYANLFMQGKTLFLFNDDFPLVSMVYAGYSRVIKVKTFLLRMIFCKHSLGFD